MTSPAVDEHLGVLSDVHRRRVLEYLLRGRRRRASVDELVEHLRTRRERQASDRSRGEEGLRVVLVHLHLPQLDAHGIVDWDRRREEVHYREDEDVEAVLDALADESVPVER